jgi:hypothetical protein
MGAEMTEPRDEHRWLQKLVGKWTYEIQTAAGPDHPPMRLTGSETVRSLGGLWVVCEGRGENPDGTTGVSIMTLGFDPEKERFVGTFVGSMMTNLWVYEGTLDPAGNALTLDTEGPGYNTPRAKYKDVIAFNGDDERVMTSAWLREDGGWEEIMRSTYRRSG